MNNHEYWREIHAITYDLIAECMEENDNDKDKALELIFDTRLHELVDGHQWVIYYAYNLDVIGHSDNADYMVDNLGSESAAHALENGGISGLHVALAFWCIYGDICDYLDTAMDDYIEALPQYVIGWNMPGFMPEMVPYDADDIEHAKECLYDEIDSYIDEIDEGIEQGDTTFNSEQLAEYKKTFKEFDSATAQECNVNIGNYVFWIKAK